MLPRFLVSFPRSGRNASTSSWSSPGNKSHAAFRNIAPRVFWLISAWLAASAVHAEPYRLGPMDRLRINIVEWQTAEGVIRDWSSVGGEYVVGPAGEIALPFVGEVAADGKTTSEIAVAISDRLQQKLGLVDRPEAAVEVVEFRPFYISGNVQNPGKFPCGADMSVIKAVSVAGGLRRTSEYNQRPERDFINSDANSSIIVLERARLLVKRARLWAEATGKTEIEPPVELRGSADLPRLMDDERGIMEARKHSLETQLTALADLKTLLASEIETLEKKEVAEDRQLSLAKEELASIGGLVEKGLVVNARRLALERSTAESQTRLLDIGTASLRAKQEISKATQDEIKLRNDRAASLALERQQVDSDIQEATLRLDMYRRLMAEAGTVSIPSSVDNLQPSYTIVRQIDGAPKEISANENTKVLPGDVIKVGAPTFVSQSQ